jgi:CheY-like chemotaxis protein
MGRRVLVVDDDALVLELTAAMLEELGCECCRLVQEMTPSEQSRTIKALKY